MIDYMEIKKELEEIGEEKAFQHAAEMLAKGRAYAQIYAALYSEEYMEVPYNMEAVTKTSERINEDAFRLMVMEHFSEAPIFFGRMGDGHGGTIL